MYHGTFYVSAEDAAAQRGAVTATQTDGGTAPTVSTQTLHWYCTGTALWCCTGSALRECWGRVVEHFNLNDLFQTRTQLSSAASRVAGGDNRETAVGIISYIQLVYDS